MDHWVKEIVEQIAIGIVLQESKLDSSNRLALICVDNGVEVALKFYASFNGLLSDRDLNSQQGFYSALGKIKDEGIISDDNARNITQNHKVRNDLYHGAKLTTVNPKIVNEYIKLIKSILFKLFNFQTNEAGWARIVNDIKKEVVKEKSEIKDPVEYSEKEVDGEHLVQMKTAVDPKNTESIMLTIFGFISKFARSPTKEELKKSLMISGRDIPENVLDARIFELRKSGSIEKGQLKLKGKALKQLRKKFII